MFDSFKELMDTLRTGGPYAVAAIAMAVAAYNYRELRAEQRARIADAQAAAKRQQDLNDRHLVTVEKVTEITIKAAEASRQLTAVIHEMRE